MKNTILNLLKEETNNNFDQLTDEFIEDLVVLSYNSDFDLAEKIYAEMQTKLEKEVLITDLVNCLDKIQNLVPFKRYLQQNTKLINEIDEAETLFWLFCERKEKDEAEYWMNQINNKDLKKAKQYFEAFFCIEELCKKIIKEEEKIYFSYSHSILTKVLKYDTKIIYTILNQLKFSLEDSEKQIVIHSLLRFADENIGSESEIILEELYNYKLSNTNKLFLINILLKNNRISEATDLYHAEFQNCINEIIESKQGFSQIAETHALLNKNNLLLENHSADYIRLIDAYNGPDLSNFAATLYSLDTVKIYIDKQYSNGTISANIYAMILAINGNIRESLVVLEKGKEKNAHKIWRLICLMCIEDESLFFECLENDLSVTSSKVELLLKLANNSLIKNMQLYRECMKKAEELITELQIYFQNTYNIELALLYYKIDDIKNFNRIYKNINSSLTRIELLNKISNSITEQ